MLTELLSYVASTILYMILFSKWNQLLLGVLWSSKYYSERYKQINFEWPNPCTGWNRIILSVNKTTQESDESIRPARKLAMYMIQTNINRAKAFHKGVFTTDGTSIACNFRCLCKKCISIRTPDRKRLWRQNHWARIGWITYLQCFFFQS